MAFGSNGQFGDTGGSGEGAVPAFEAIVGEPADNEALQEVLDEKLSNTSGIALLASETVQTNVGTKQTLYTVPTGKKCIVIAVIPKEPSGDLSGLESGATVGFNVGANNVLSIVKSQLSDLTSLSASAPSTFGATFIIGTAGEVLGIIFEDASVTGTIQTDVFGYLY